MMCVVFLVVWLVALTPVAAQIDELAESPSSVPQWDALERYREDPLCLPCLKASELTVLPGISIRSAGRILAAVKAGLSTLEQVADSACLSLDQTMIIYACTSISCSCDRFIESARLVQRVITEPGVSPDHSTRIDVSGTYGRIGGIMRSNTTGSVQGGWLQAVSEPVTVTLGDMALGAGTGLVHGSAGGFGRSAFARALNINTDIRLRPWTSTWRDGSMRGIALQSKVGVDSVQLHTAAVWSNHTNVERPESSLHAAATISTSGWTLGAATQHLWYHAGSTSLSTTVVREPQRAMWSLFGTMHLKRYMLHGEVAIDDSMRFATSAVFRLERPRSRIVVGARWMHPDLRNPYAGVMSSRSSLGNEGGVLFGLMWREPRGWNIEAALDLHQTLSRSYGRPLPSRGFDLVVDGQRPLSRGTLNVRFRYEVDDEGWRPEGTSATIMVTQHRMTTRCSYALSVVREVDMRVRADVRNVWWTGARESELGLLCSADILWYPTRTLRISASCIAARSASIESAAYTMIVPVPGALRTIVGSGQRSWLTAGLRFRPTSWITVSAALAEQTYFAQIEIRNPK